MGTQSNASETTAADILECNVHLMGLRIVSMPMDGDCLFRAWQFDLNVLIKHDPNVRDHLVANSHKVEATSNEGYCSALRTSAVLHIMHNHNRFADFLTQEQFSLLKSI